MKCNKQKPCSACIKNDCTDSCIYAKDSARPVVKPPRESNLKTELVKLKMKMNIMEKVMKAHNIDFSTLIDDEALYDKYTSKKNQDECISTLLDKFDTMVIKENSVFRSGLVTCLALVQKDSQINSFIKPFKNQESTQFSKYLTKQQKKASDYPLGTTSLEMLNENDCFQSGLAHGLDDFMSILNEINKILPPSHIFNLMIDRFFKYIYHFLPFVNREVFEEEISRVLIVLPNGDINFGITHLQNASIISLVLIILNLSIATAQSDGHFDRSLNSTRYPDLAIKLIESIKGNESVLNKCNLRTIQVYLFQKCYEMYVKPVPTSFVASTMHANRLISMARIQGIFRDPSYFSNNIHTDKRQFDVIRRIAYKLHLIDWQSSFESGSHLMIFENELDVRMPQLSKKEKEIVAAYKRGESTGYAPSEIDKLIIESQINSDTALEYEVSLLVRRCFNITQTNDKTVSKKQLIGALLELERFTEDKLPHIYDLIQWKSENHSHIRILELRCWLLQFMITSNYLLITNEEANGHPDNDLFNASVVKTTEYSLQYFKFVFDYSYFCKCRRDPSAVNLENSTLINILNTFSRNLDPFILTFSNRGFMHPMCWIGSLFYRTAKAKTLNLDLLVEKFENNTDSTNVLQWFLCYQSWSPSLTLNDQFPFILFTYLKQFVITLSPLKDGTFYCQKNWFMIKIFVKNSKLYERETYELFIKNDFFENLNEKEDPEIGNCEVPEFLGVQKIELNDSEKEISKNFEYDFLDQTPFDINNFYQQIMEEVDVNGIDLSEIPFIKDLPPMELPSMIEEFPSINSSSAMSSTTFSPLDNN